MSEYAIHALLGINGSKTDEASIEAETLEEVFVRVRELVQWRPDFHAITILHASDLPAALEGTLSIPEPSTGPPIGGVS